MHPILFKIGNFPLYSYGAMLAIGLIVALQIARKRAPLYGLKPEKAYDAVFVALILGILGARVTYIAQEWPYYAQPEHHAELWSLRFQGLTSFGGVAFGLLGLWIWAKFAKQPFRVILDIFGAPFLVAHAIGRVGCLLNGCCYGRACSAWYCVPMGNNLPQHFGMAQLVDTALNLVGFAALMVIERRGTLKLGQSFGIAMVLHGTARFLYEFLRAGTVPEVKAGLASSTLIPGTPFTEGHAAALAVVLVGAAMWAANRKAQSPQGLVPAA